MNKIRNFMKRRYWTWLLWITATIPLVLTLGPVALLLAAVVDTLRIIGELFVTVFRTIRDASPKRWKARRHV